MAKRTGPTNPSLQKLIADVHKVAYDKDVKFWQRIAEELKKPTRNRREVNIGKINEHADGKMDIAVPGKVLGGGTIDHPVTVYAWKFSSDAKEKITLAKGKALTLSELLKTNPSGKKVRIIG